MNELRYRVTELENEKLQYEKKLKCTKVSSHGRGREAGGPDGKGLTR